MNFLKFTNFCITRFYYLLAITNKKIKIYQTFTLFLYLTCVMRHFVYGRYFQLIFCSIWHPSINSVIKKSIFLFIGVVTQQRNSSSESEVMSHISNICKFCAELDLIIWVLSAYNLTYLGEFDRSAQLCCRWQPKNGKTILAERLKLMVVEGHPINNVIGSQWRRQVCWCDGATAYLTVFSPVGRPHKCKLQIVVGRSVAKVH